MIDLSGGHILVVGGSRGIGAAAARCAARCGADVSIVYQRDAEAAARVCRTIEEGGRRAGAHRADVADRDAVFAAVDAAVAELGPLTGAVCSAAILEHCPLLTVDPVSWDRALGVNLSGTLWSVQAAVRHMDRGDSIVIYSSTAGQPGGPQATPYAVTKAAQLALTRGLAKELGPRGIRVNAIAPAWTETDMITDLIADQREEVTARFVLGRIGEPDDVAKATAYLLSSVSGFVTGSTHTVDGGMAMKG